MKILLVQDFLRNGGTERQTVLLAGAFAAAGHAVTLLTFRPGGALDPTVPPAVNRRVLQPFDMGLDWFAPGLLRVARALQPDVVLCMGRMANCHAGFLQRALPSRPVLATMRTGKPLPFLFRRSLRAVRHVVANSHEAAATLRSLHDVPSDHLTVIHNSIVFPAGTGPDRDDTLRARLGATPATTVFLCVAMFRPEKNQHELIEILAGLPPDRDWQLWLAGEGSDRSACEKTVESLRLSSRVRFLGFLSDPSPLYRAADIAVHASRSEALSNFLIEAQAHGLPVVALQAQGIEECFLPGLTGWAIPRHDHNGFRATILRLMSSNSTDRATLASTARARAREAFDPARQADRYLTLFQVLIARSSA